MLWVYNDASPEGWKASGAAAAAAAAARAGPGQLSLTPALPSSAADVLLDLGWTLKSPWFQRDIPLSFDILMENMHDPSHVPQSHSGVIVRLAN
jgi:phenylpropionate dioxygenase-like ring-hydroxylating dioxygenase large terminal subunit